MINNILIPPFLINNNKCCNDLHEKLKRSWFELLDNIKYIERIEYPYIKETSYKNQQDIYIQINSIEIIYNDIIDLFNNAVNIYVKLIKNITSTHLIITTMNHINHLQKKPYTYNQLKKYVDTLTNNIYDLIDKIHKIALLINKIDSDVFNSFESNIRENMRRTNAMIGGGRIEDVHEKIFDIKNTLKILDEHSIRIDNIEENEEIISNLKTKFEKENKQELNFFKLENFNNNKKIDDVKFKLKWNIQTGDTIDPNKLNILINSIQEKINIYTNLISKIRIDIEQNNKKLLKLNRFLYVDEKKYLASEFNINNDGNIFVELNNQKNILNESYNALEKYTNIKNFLSSENFNNILNTYNDISEHKNDITPQNLIDMSNQNDYENIERIKKLIQTINKNYSDFLDDKTGLKKLINNLLKNPSSENINKYNKQFNDIETLGEEKKINDKYHIQNDKIPKLLDNLNKLNKYVESYIYSRIFMNIYDENVSTYLSEYKDETIGQINKLIDEKIINESAIIGEINKKIDIINVKINNMNDMKIDIEYVKKILNNIGMTAEKINVKMYDEYDLYKKYEKLFGNEYHDLYDDYKSKFLVKYKELTGTNLMQHGGNISTIVNKNDEYYNRIYELLLTLDKKQKDVILEYDKYISGISKILELNRSILFYIFYINIVLNEIINKKYEPKMYISYYDFKDRYERLKILNEPLLNGAIKHIIEFSNILDKYMDENKIIIIDENKTSFINLVLFMHITG